MEQIAPLTPAPLTNLQLPQHNIRLGHLVERYIIHQLQQNTNTQLLTSNLQIKHNKQTIGELDVIFLQNNTPIHLEIVYKFYVYDETVGSSELEHWIGPNRKDSLVEKLHKLKTKQLPLLHKPEAISVLKQLNISPDKTKQYVHFQAQLFVPYQQNKTTYPKINQGCIVGFYVNLKNSSNFKTCQWYIPSKHNWLVTPHNNVPWSTYTSVISEIKNLLANNKAPLCWLKTPDNKLEKIFVVWW